jgi:glycosyltransferase involved in cell wall biosynthesis
MPVAVGERVMTSYIDVTAAMHQYAGIARYAANLARALVYHHGADHRFGVFHLQNRSTRAVSGLEGVPDRTVRSGYKPWRMAVWLGQRLGIYFDRLLPDAVLFHATEHLLMPLRNVRTVLTVHDLVYHLFPAYHRSMNYWYLNTAMPLFARRADAVIAISQSTKRDLMRYYQVPEDKITVVYEAASSRFRPASAEAVAEAKASYRLPDKYVLALGTIEPRKNLNRLLDAVCMIRQKDPELSLVIVGHAGWLYQDFFQHIEKLDDPKAVLLSGYVPDADLPAVITGAKAYVLASFYEGFGLPILEAMACGTPVVSSNTSSMPELGAKAARYFDPHDLQDMVTAISAVLEDADLREEMRRRGFEQAARFSWKRTARETLAVYNGLLAS